MAKLAVFVVYVYVQAITCQCIRNRYPGMIGPGLAAESFAYAAKGMPYAPTSANWPSDTCGLNLATLSASNGRGFFISSSAPYFPNGVTVQSENMVIEGPLAVNGQLPFLGTIVLEGALPASGMGSVSYGCGNDNIGIQNEGIRGFEYANDLGYDANMGLGRRSGYGMATYPRPTSSCGCSNLL